MLRGRRILGVMILLCVAAIVLLLRAEIVRTPHPHAARVTDITLPDVTLDRVTTRVGPRLMVTSQREIGAISSGLRVGDWIEDVDGAPVRSRADLRRDIAREAMVHGAVGGTLERKNSSR
jgi:hypothetical protein